MTPDEIRLKNDAIVLRRGDEIRLKNDAIVLRRGDEIRLKNDAIVLRRGDEIRLKKLQRRRRFLQVPLLATRYSLLTRSDATLLPRPTSRRRP